MIYLSIGLVIAIIWYAFVIAHAIKPFEATKFNKTILTLGMYDADNEYENSNGDLFMLMMLSVLVALMITLVWGFILAVTIIYYIVKAARDYNTPITKNK